jgi:hypothetical protein
MSEQEAGAVSLAAMLDRSRAMAMSRKLGKEIELALKKVSDGIAGFHDLSAKMMAAEVSALPPRLQISLLPASILHGCRLCIACLAT